MTVSDLQRHLETGASTVCRVWTVWRRDGEVIGFTDHDRDLKIDGVVHRAGTGLTASAIQQGTGLAVDNSEALGALSDAAVSESDLIAGRFDGAAVRIQLVDWADTTRRHQIFRGTFGEVTRRSAQFRVELRGLSDALNQPQGLAYTRNCSAVLGDRRCRFDLSQPGYSTERTVETVDDFHQVLTFASFAGFDDRWFEFGRLEVLTGAASGLVSAVKSDRIEGAGRRIELWEGIRVPLAAGDSIRLIAGCDKRIETCRSKFANLLNFRGFPHLPGEDWLAAYPRPGQGQSGGSLSAGSAT